MPIDFETDEVIRIAEKIEERGVEMYRRAASIYTVPEVNKLLIRLARDEDTHREIFKAMRESNSHSGGIVISKPQDKMVVDYLGVFSDEIIFGDDDDPLVSLTGEESLDEVLDIAVRKEMESVMFYLGMKEAVRDEHERNKIDQIIWEELGHFASLKNELAKLKGKLN
ncbi:MAG: ferritin family protein [bacterium]|nr:ferritin family protein [bacterium]